MNAEGTISVKGQSSIGKQISMQLKVFRTNLLEFQTNLQKLGLAWLIKLSVSVILLLVLYFLYFI